MNETEYDVQSIAHLEFKPSCTFRLTGLDGSSTQECGAEALWAARSTCCGYVAFQCRDHRVPSSLRKIHCRACGANFARFADWLAEQWRI